MLNKLPNEILEKIYLFAHPTLSKEIKEEIKKFKFPNKLNNSYIEIRAINYNILRILGHMNNIMFL